MAWSIDDAIGAAPGIATLLFLRFHPIVAATAAERLYQMLRRAPRNVLERLRPPGREPTAEKLHSLRHTAPCIAVDAFHEVQQGQLQRACYKGCCQAGSGGRR